MTTGQMLISSSAMLPPRNLHLHEPQPETRVFTLVQDLSEGEVAGFLSLCLAMFRSGII